MSTIYLLLRETKNYSMEYITSQQVYPIMSGIYLLWCEMTNYSLEYLTLEYTDCKAYIYETIQFSLDYSLT